MPGGCQSTQRVPRCPAGAGIPRISFICTLYTSSPRRDTGEKQALPFLLGSFAQPLQGFRGRCWDAHRVLGVLPGAGDTHRVPGGMAGARDASTVPGCLLGVGDVSGMSTGTGMTTGCRDGHWGFPEGARCPRVPPCPEVGGCSQGPAMSPRCRGRVVAGLWCHLVGCRLPVAPVWRGEGGTGPWLPGGGAPSAGLGAQVQVSPR